MTPDPQPKRRNRARNYKKFDDNNVLTPARQAPRRTCAGMPVLMPFEASAS